MKRKKNDASLLKKDFPMDLSVIIPSFNNCGRLKITLDAFAGLAIPSGVSWELILVNNNSSDSTKDVALWFSDQLPIKYIEEPKQGTSHAKNTGLQNAAGKLIIFTDDDVKPCKKWIQLYWQEYKKNPKGYFWGGPVESEFEVPPDNMDLIRLGPPSVKGLYWGKVKKKMVPGEYFIGANWAAPADIVKEIGGFDTQMGLNPSSGKILVGEETDLMNRLKTCELIPLYLPEALIQHFVPESKTSLVHIASRAEAEGRFNVDKTLDSSSVSFLGIPRWIYKQVLVYWIRSKAKRILSKNWYPDYLAYRRLVGSIKQIKGK